MMDTPICDFVSRYAEKDPLRLHMPGHKGAHFLGMEHLDITEIDGADDLYGAEGIIKCSEENAGKLFDCSTYYVVEGASQCIRGMLYLAMLQAKKAGKKPLILAARNVHKSMLSAAALLDLDVEWLYPDETDSYLSCHLDEQKLESAIKNASGLPTAVYLTSPDYLGKMTDIRMVAEVCHRYGILLLVDNAHGAYLKFLPQSRHPMDLGADICCDSAHKTLPVLTGGAYLHISSGVSLEMTGQVRNALALFGSTSPSYLILQSLDAANGYLEGYAEKLQGFLPAVEALKTRLRTHGYVLYGDEPLKLTICAKAYGYTGCELAGVLAGNDVISEFSDPDYLVLMLTPETGEAGLRRLETALLSIPRKEPILQKPPSYHRAEKVMSVRGAAMSLSEALPVEQCDGRILAFANMGCPPAVPILVYGERIDQNAIDCFRYYGFDRCNVVIE